MGTARATTSFDNNNRSHSNTTQGNSNSIGAHTHGSASARPPIARLSGTNGVPEGPNATQSNAAPPPSFSVQSDILRRLGKLFSMNQNTTHHRSGSGGGGGDRGLMTEFILSNFRDLGDQYASIFKQSLHQIASMKDGKWYLKK